MKEEKIRGVRLFLTIFLCLVCISVGQMLQALVQKEINGIFGLNIVGYVVSTIIYIGFVYIMLKIICIKVLHTSMELCRIGKLQIQGKWFIVALLLPLFVSIIMLCIPGELIVNNLDRTYCIDVLALQIFVYGLGGAIVEEMIFRGVMMSSIENRCGRIWAIIIPSVIFALGHLANDKITLSTLFMKMIAGICVGCMFSLVVYESKSIWNSVIIHALWNASITGGLINISLVHDVDSIFSYVIDKEYSFITGGALSVEPSLIAILGYFLVSVFAINCWRKKNKNKVLLSKENTEC